MLSVKQGGIKLFIDKLSHNTYLHCPMILVVIVVVVVIIITIVMIMM